MTVKVFCYAVVIAIGAVAIAASNQQETRKIRSAETIIKTGPYSFPEKLARDRFNNLYLLDTQLSNVFMVQRRRGESQVKALCSPRTPVAAADLSIDKSGGVWILDSTGSKVVKLDHICKVTKSFTTQRSGHAIEINTAGELIVLTTTGKELFDVYDQTGELIRSFGQRLSYGDPIADAELNNGHLVADKRGGFYFSFNYPPLVQHYGRDGNLLSEFRPQSDVPLGHRT